MEPRDGQDFWAYMDRLVDSSRVIIDRSRGGAHPRYPEMIYPVDYGYLEGTKTADGGGIDVWSGSSESRSLSGAILTVDLLKRDAELKLLLGCTEAEVQAILGFLNEASMGAYLVRRGMGQVEWLKSRRSVRRFRPEPVLQATLEQLLLAAAWAPSAHNRQPWRFAALTSAGAKTRVAEAMGAEFRRDLLADGLPETEVEAQVERSYLRITQAPAAVMVCLNMGEMDPYPDERRQQAEFLMGVQSTSMAGENLLLAAHALGLGGVWICAPLFAQESVRRCLDLPPEWQPLGLVLLGYPDRVPEPRPRKPLGEVARFL